MVQGGYVSPSSAKTLTVNKKTNVLNKIPPRGPKGATNNSNSTNNNNNNNDTPTITTSSIDVSAMVFVYFEQCGQMFAKFYADWLFFFYFEQAGSSTEGTNGRAEKTK